MYKVAVFHVDSQVVRFESESSYDVVADGRMVNWYTVYFPDTGNRITNFSIPIIQILSIQETEIE